MKKNRKIALHSLLITFMIPSATLGIQPDGVPTKSFWRRAIEAVKEKLPTRQSFYEKLPALRNKLAQAAALIKQKSYCLFKYDACTKRDKLLISNASGFLVGYGVRYPDLLNRMFPTPGLDIRGVDTGVTILNVALFLARFMGLSGALFSLGKTEPWWYLPTLIQGYLSAKSKTVWLDAMKGYPLLPILPILVAHDAYIILKEAAFAFRYDGKLSLRNVARYLKMNAQCVWSESYCMPKEQAESRRRGLYFWLGFIEGALLYQLKIKTWGKREYEQAPMPPAMPVSPIFVAADLKNKVDHLKSKHGRPVIKDAVVGEEFEWYEILDVDSKADNKTIRQKYTKLSGIYHPDKHQGNPDYNIIQTIFNTAKEMALSKR